MSVAFKGTNIIARAYRFSLRSGGPVYESLMVDAGGHKVEITVSPTGRSVHVHLDGERVGP